jgi:Acetyltransferase (GNAT) domain
MGTPPACPLHVCVPDSPSAQRSRHHGAVTTSPDPAELGYRNLIAFSRAVTRWSTWGALEESDGVVLCAGGSWIPLVGNAAYRTDTSVDPTELISRARDFFAGVGRGFSIKVRDNGEDDDLRQACLAAGIEGFGETAPQMLVRHPLPDHPPVPGVTVRPVDDEGGLRAFVAVNAEAYGTYGLPPEEVDVTFGDAARVLADPACHIVIASRGSTPVATAMIYESDGVASVQWVGTVPAARKSGLGALVTSRVTNLAFTRGASSVTLQASPMGAPVYLALGYETLYNFAEYVVWKTA